MRGIVLGSGGSQPTPKAGCTCRVCTRARLEGGKNARSGPSLFLPDHHVLIDTPEESNAQLNAAGALELKVILFSHFHPDHTAGVRVVEYIARWGAPGVPSFMPDDLEESLSQVSLFRFQRDMKHLEVRRVRDREPWNLGELRVTALRHRSDMPMYSYLFEDSGGRGLYNADHFITLDLDGLRDLDWAVVQVGLMPDGVQERSLPPDHPARKVLVPIARVCEMAVQRGWKRLVFSHLYEAIRLHPEEYDDLARKLSEQHGLDVAFAFDGMVLEGSGAGNFGSEKTMLEKPVPLELQTTEALLERLREKREAIEREYRDDRPRMRQEMRELMSAPEQKELERRSSRRD